MSYLTIKLVTIGHQLYEDIRSIEAIAKTEGRRLTPEEDRQIENLRSQMERLYNEAYGNSSQQN